MTDELGRHGGDGSRMHSGAAHVLTELFVMAVAVSSTATPSLSVLHGFTSPRGKVIFEGLFFIFCEEGLLIGHRCGNLSFGG
jgi:hypothetical protein